MTTSVCARILAKIELSRRIGTVVSGCAERPFASPAAAALEFGLSGKPEIYREIAADEAIAVLAAALQRDMAYDQQIMSAARAIALAREFAGCFPAGATRYFTNGTFGSEQTRRSWSPATDATFDTGVIALSNSLSACLWFEDED